MSRLGTWLGVAAFAAVLAIVGCDDGDPGLGVGQQCRTELNSRDCEEGLVCVFNYDACPTYGCPTCRRPCRASTDCNQAESGCGHAPQCVFQGRTFERGVCEICDDGDPYR